MPRHEKQILSEEEVDQHIESLAEWTKGRKQIPNFADRRFLLSFLHICKFDQDAARKRLTKYWKSRKNGIMKLMNGVDPSSTDILSILRGPHAVYAPLPGVDKEGRRVIMARWNQLDVSGQTYKFEDWFRAITVIFDAMCMLDVDTAENGVTFLMDANQVSVKHLTFFGFGNSMKQFSVMQKGYPIKIKKVHYINNNSAIDIFFNTVKVVISSKLSERIKLHGYSLVPVYEDIGMDNLPEDYLPDDYDGPCAGMFGDIMETFITNVLLKPDNSRMLQRLYSCMSQGSPAPRGVTTAGDTQGELTQDSDTDDAADIDNKLKDLKL